MTNNLTIAYLVCDGNDLYHSVLSTCLLSTIYLSPRDDKKGSLKGQGVFIYQQINTRSIALFSVRSLIKSNWIISNGVYIGRED